MGVSGLTTFIEHNSEKFLNVLKLHDCNLVIDGNSLACQLYSLSNGNSSFGGSYDSFAVHIRKFFSRLKKCNVTSYVLFDGGYEQKKMRTIINRMKDKISAACRLTYYNEKSLKLFPLLLIDVLMEVLKEMDIKYTSCEFEADDEIASTARDLNCPVLSYDSDFYIYNVLYIPFPTLNAKVSSSTVDGRCEYFIFCKLFKVQNITKHFKGLEAASLPLLAVLLGNDYIKKSTFLNFFSHLKLPNSKTKANRRQRLIKAILLWLSHENLETAIGKIINHVRRDDKPRILELIRKNCAVYFEVPSESLSYLDINKDEGVASCSVTKGLTSDENVDVEGEVITNLDYCEFVDVSSDSESDCDAIDTEFKPLNMQIIHLIRQNQFPLRYINLYCTGSYYCTPQVEESSQANAFLCSFKIIRYAYDIMRGLTSNKVYICGRQGLKLNRFVIEPDENAGAIYEKNNEKLFYFFFERHIPNENIKQIWSLPTDLQIFILTLVWWYKNAEDISVSHIYSLIVCYLSLNIVDGKMGIFRGHFHFNNKFSSKLLKLRDEVNITKAKNHNVTNKFDLKNINKDKISYNECLLANSKLLEFFDISNSLIKNPKSFDRRVIHSFSQFQTCLLNINNLNTVCGFPLQSSTYSKTYNGVFVYNAYHSLSRHKDPYAYMCEYLCESPNLLYFFQAVCDFLHKLILKSEMPNKDKNLKQNKANGPTFNNNKFDLLKSAPE